MIAAAHGDLLTIRHYSRKVAVCICPDLFEILQIDYCRAMYAQECVRIQPCLHRRNRLSQKVRFGASVDANVILFRTYPSNLGDTEEQNAPTGLEHHASQMPIPIGFMSKTVAGYGLL